MKLAKMIFGVGVLALCAIPVMAGPPGFYGPRPPCGPGGVRLAADIVDLVGAALRIPAAVVGAPLLPVPAPVVVPAPVPVPAPVVVPAPVPVYSCPQPYYYDRYYGRYYDRCAPPPPRPFYGGGRYAPGPAPHHGPGGRPFGGPPRR